MIFEFDSFSPASTLLKPSFNLYNTVQNTFWVDDHHHAPLPCRSAVAFTSHPYHIAWLSTADHLGECAWDVDVPASKGIDSRTTQDIPKAVL
jgi:proteasome lid subunit RPN8/RPN11